MRNAAVLLAARILVPSVFVGLGLSRLLVAAGVMAGPPVSGAGIAFSAFELIAGVLIMAGWKLKWIAGLMAAFITVDAFLAHAFWSYPAEERHGQLLHFLKNMSALGGLLLLVWMDGAQAREKSVPAARSM
jgi:putative oxidoreductase